RNIHALLKSRSLYTGVLLGWDTCRNRNRGAGRRCSTARDRRKISRRRLSYRLRRRGRACANFLIALTQLVNTTLVRDSASFTLFYLIFARASEFFPALLFFDRRIFLTSTGHMPQITHQVRNR